MEDLTNKFKIVGMNEIDITSIDFPIIGTQGLATCVGILLYSEKNHKAIVAHIADNPIYFFEESIRLIGENNLDNDIIYYAIIPGGYLNHYRIKEILENEFQQIPTLFKPLVIPEYSIQIDQKTGSLEFAFDSKTGTFVTSKVEFGGEYQAIHNEEIKTK